MTSKTTNPFAFYSERLAAAGIAVVLFYGLFQVQERVLMALGYWWEKVGVVMLGLLPLSMFLMVLILALLMSESRRAPWIGTGLRVVAIAGPMLGFLGTVLGVAEGAAQFTMAEGVEALLTVVTDLMQGVSVALLSTAWGTLLGLPAAVLNEIFFADPPPVAASNPEQLATERLQPESSIIQPEATPCSTPEPL